MNLIKHLFSLMLPVTVLVLVPRWIQQPLKAHSGIYASGWIFIVAGLIVMTITITSFAIVGKGTLAPWTPTRRLVISGLYRYVRNPMILGVFTVLCGEAILFKSSTIAIWAACFLVINTVYFIMYEEPDLERKFGDDYKAYKSKVRRWIPNFKPYVSDFQ